MAIKYDKLHLGEVQDFLFSYNHLEKAVPLRV